LSTDDTIKVAQIAQTYGTGNGTQVAISVDRLLQELDDMPVVLPRIRGVLTTPSTLWITPAIALPAVVICKMLTNRYWKGDSCATADIYQRARRPLIRSRGTPTVTQRRMQKEMVTFSPQADDDDQEPRLPERTPRQGDVLAMC
jgi:hypothetical protein